MFPENTRQTCRLFAEVLDYPDEATPETVSRCIRELEEACPESVKPMRSFLEFVQARTPGSLAELYTQTFDIVPARTLYIGHHIFGENPKRSTFLVRLQEAYQSHQFSAGSELPDHLCVMLRFLSVAEDREFVDPLLQECLLPVLHNLEKGFKKDKDKNGYGSPLSSLRLFLRRLSGSLDKTGGVTV